MPVFGNTCCPNTEYASQAALWGIQAREYLYFKIYGKECVTPAAIMTSSAKNNHEHITSLCEKLEGFKRGRSRFQLFERPLVPAVSAEDRQWIIRNLLHPFASLVVMV